MSALRGTGALRLLDDALGIAAAGTTQTTATTLPADNCSVTSIVANVSTGVILAAGNASDMRCCGNATQQVLTVYPPVGAAFTGLSVNQPIYLPGLKCALFFFLNAANIQVISIMRDFSNPLGYSKIQVATLQPLTLTSGTLSAIPAGAAFAVITTEGDDGRWRDDGVLIDPINSMPLPVGSTLVYDGKLANLALIGVSYSTVFNVSFYG